MQQAYLKATPQEKRENKFFKVLPIEEVIDNEAIRYAQKSGLTAQHLLTGKMSNEVKQKLDYMKSKHRSGLLLKNWSRDGYWCKQNELLKVEDPAVFTDTIERIHVNDISVEEFIERYERKSRPVIIQGVTDSWLGNTEW